MILSHALICAGAGGECDSFLRDYNLIISADCHTTYFGLTLLTYRVVSYQRTIYAVLQSAILNCQGIRGSIAVPFTVHHHPLRSHCWERHHYAKSKFLLQEGEIPQWGRAGELYLSPSEYQTDSSAPSCKRRGGPFPRLLRCVWGACTGCRVYFPSLHRVEGA